jgi:probable Rubsico expression protein CbbX
VTSEQQGRPGFGMPTPGQRSAEQRQPGESADQRPLDEPSGSREQPEAEGTERLAEDAEVDLGAERKAAGIDEVLESLDRELVGLSSVKTRIQEIAALLLVDRVRDRFGLAASRPNLHMSFTGGPGTGKTTVAMRMAELLHRVGYLERGHLVAVTRDDLVGQYVGHTAPKTKEVLKRAMGGVLFIDEAYYLYRAENERDYGQESIEILLQVMENQRDDLVVILAGYQDRMEEFFTSNPGMSSRIAHHLHFPDYGLDELCAIADRMLEEQRYCLSPEAREVLRDYLRRRMRRPRFANARSVRNALERARLRHANRLVDTPDRTWGRVDVMRLEPADFLASRVFSEPDSIDTAESSESTEPPLVVGNEPGNEPGNASGR